MQQSGAAMIAKLGHLSRAYIKKYVEQFINSIIAQAPEGRWMCQWVSKSHKLHERGEGTCSNTRFIGGHM